VVKTRAGFDRDSLKSQLKQVHPKAAAIIGLRAALRALPVLAIRSKDKGRAFGFWKANARNRNLLAIFRCYQAGNYSNSLLELDKHSIRLAATAVRAAGADANAAISAAATAHYAAVRAAQYATDACADAIATLAYRAADFSGEAYSDVAAYATDSYANAAAYSAHYAMYAAAAAGAAPAITAALEHDLTVIGAIRSRRNRAKFFEQPLWPEGAPAPMKVLWQRLKEELEALDAGFDIWTDWYEDRLISRPLDLEVERNWALLPESRLAQKVAEVNAYLRSLLLREATQPLNRVRAIFIGHGGVGKTSVIRTLHGETVIDGDGAMTPGVAIKDSGIALDEEAGVFTHEHRLEGADLTVHFWDFGGQVMAHATHQFFLREQCLYVIVLDARKERNANEEAEYWLEHVRAFGKNSPVMLVGNKSDQAQVNLDLRTLKEKYRNTVGFYPLSCTEAHGRFRAEFERFDRDFREQLTKLGTSAQLFTKPQFLVLRALQEKAADEDFLERHVFETICAEKGIATDGPAGREALLDLFDKLGIVIHFPQLPFFEDFVLNPRWLTYGVYQVLYSARANDARGRITNRDLVDILRPLSLTQPDGRTLRFPTNRCQLIADAMVAFRVAYRLAFDTQQLVIPALLEPQQPAHDFVSFDAMTFQFDFKGLLPRNVLPALIVDHHQDIAQHPETGEQIVWQYGVLLRPERRYDASALIKADYYERKLDIVVSGSDAQTYLGLIRDGILRILKTMPDLPYEEKLRLLPTMRLNATAADILSGAPVWIAYKIVETALKNKLPALPGPDGHMYAVDKIVRMMPVSPEVRPADIFISYKRHSGDRAIVDELASDLERSGYSVWFDREMIGGQRFSDVIDQRIDTAKAVVAL
jgi:GTPase SAR1 family protein